MVTHSNVVFSDNLHNFHFICEVCQTKLMKLRKRWVKLKRDFVYQSPFWPIIPLAVLTFVTFDIMDRNYTHLQVVFICLKIVLIYYTILKILLICYTVLFLRHPVLVTSMVEQHLGHRKISLEHLAGIEVIK